MSINAVIIDIDGTIADLTHRRHHVSAGKKEWGKFFEKMGDDLPIYPVIDTIQSVIEGNKDTAFFICTGRPEDNRKVTESWLAYHCPALWDQVGSDMLLMRPSGDFRSDVIVKSEMLENIEGQNFTVVATFDDRQSVVDMWRSRGITCFQCAPGDFDTKPPVSPGVLHMLVGPSGAGKSYFAAYELNVGLGDDDQLMPDAVVSSDALRAGINNGDIKNQSNNTQVFSALRAIVKARIENGLDTVVDATNLRNKDRRVIRDAVPRTCHIFYHVIDRPLKEKHKDAGWRAEVSIKGKLLIDYHHHIFRSNIKAIMSGDDDQRVSIIDHRSEDIK
jgi:predicted kinase